MTPASLCAHLLMEKHCNTGRVERLDHRTDAELVGLLAAAAQIVPARLQAMRVATDDGTASCWFRQDAAWCPECVRGDLAQGPEVHERATWRLGCSVMCPEHGISLQDTCGRCWEQPRCRFGHAKGWLQLACSLCGRTPYKLDQPVTAPEFGDAGAFGVHLTPGLAVLAGEMQRDLQAALLGAAPIGPWTTVRSGPLLLRIVRDFTLCTVLARDIKVEQRTELVTDKGRIPYVTVLHEPVTPAALSPFAAFGVLAIAGTVLASMAPDGSTSHTWLQDRRQVPINARWFLEWLGDRARTLLRASALEWDHPAGAEFGVGIARTGSTAAVA